MRKLSWAFSVVAVVVICWAGATPASAAETRVSIKLSPSHARVSGKVGSRKDACETSRRVKLFFAFSTSDDFTRVDSDLSSAKGKWSIPGPDGSDIPDGRLYAAVPKKHGCAKAKSKTIRSDQGGVALSGW